MSGRPPHFLGHDGAITLVAALLAAVMTLGVAPGLAMLAVRRAARRARPLPEKEPARILVLGHRLEDGRASREFAARLSRALDLARRYPAARVWVLGGVTSAGAPAEAEVGRDWLIARGLDPARIGMETHSRHTLENLRYYRDAAAGGGAEALVTSRLHLHRALLMARGLGLAPMPVAAEDVLRPDLPRLFGEGFMVHWYRTGRAFARLFRRRSWLARIG